MSNPQKWAGGQNVRLVTSVHRFSFLPQPIDFKCIFDMSDFTFWHLKKRIASPIFALLRTMGKWSRIGMKLWL